VIHRGVFTVVAVVANVHITCPARVRPGLSNVRATLRGYLRPADDGPRAQTAAGHPCFSLVEALSSMVAGTPRKARAGAGMEPQGPGSFIRARKLLSGIQLGRSIPR